MLNQSPRKSIGHLNNIKINTKKRDYSQSVTNFYVKKHDFQLFARPNVRASKYNHSMKAKPKDKNDFSLKGWDDNDNPISLL